MHAETLALLTKPLYFPNMKYLKYLCDVTLSVYPPRAGLKNMPGHGGNQTTTFGILAQSHRGQAYFSSLPGVDIHSE